MNDGDRRALRSAGFLVLPGAIPPPLLTRLREMADRLESEVVAAHAAGRQPQHAAVFDSPSGPVVERLDKLLEHDAEATLDLLATPAMMQIARDLVGHGCVPIEMDLLFKHQHPNGSVIWHQGAQHARRRPYLNVGVHLDDSPAGDGCLRFVPGTHTERQDICALTTAHGWELPGAVDVPTSAGDVVVQDMMVLHCSLPKRSPGCRRTVYIELRPAEAIVDEGAQSPRWAELRRRWMAMVVARAHPAAWPDQWRRSLPAVGPTEEEVAAIAAAWEPPLPAHYCDHRVDHPDYPVPADLRESVRGT